MFGSPPGGHICFLYFCAGCSTSLVLMELVSFLGPPLLLMFLLLVSSSMFVVSLTIFFLLAVLYNNAVRWISLTEYLSNKLSNFFFCWLSSGFITTVFFLSDSHPSAKNLMLVPVELHEPGALCHLLSIRVWFLPPCLPFSPSSKLLLPVLFTQMVLN